MCAWQRSLALSEDRRAEQNRAFDLVGSANA
jgi:hypothetical protein